MTNTIKEGEAKSPSKTELEEIIRKVFEEQYREQRETLLIEFPTAYELVKTCGILIKEKLEFEPKNPKSIKVTKYVKKRLDKLGLKYNYIEIIPNNKIILPNEDFEKYESKWKKLENEYGIEVRKYFNMPGFTFKEI